LILKPDGTALTSSSTFGTGGGFIDTKTLPTAGTYTIVANPSLAYTGTTTVILYGVPDDLAPSISPGGPPVGVSLLVPGQNARAQFAGSAGQRVSIQLTADTIKQAYVSIIKPDGTALASATLIVSGGGFIDTRSLPVSGSYTLLVDPYQAATGSATLTLYDVPPDAAGSITAGGAGVTLTTGTPGQNARASFAGVAGRRISLALTSGTYSQVKVSILNPDGTTLVSPQLFGSSGFIDTKTLPSSGSYTIVVDPQGVTTGHITLMLYDVPADAAGSITAGGAGVTLTTGTPGQNARASFAGVAGRRISLALTSGTYSQVRVSILNPDGTTLVSPQLFGSSGFIDTKTLPSSGSYTIAVDPYQAATGSATLTLYDVPPDAAAAVTVGSAPTSISTGVPGQNAAVTLTASAGQAITIKLTGSTYSLARVSLLRPDGSVLVSPRYFGTSGTSFAATAATAGSYTIVIDPSQGYTGGVTVTVTSP
jgi:hypothetical protein